MTFKVTVLCAALIAVTLALMLATMVFVDKRVADKGALGHFMMPLPFIWGLFVLTVGFGCATVQDVPAPDAQSAVEYHELTSYEVAGGICHAFWDGGSAQSTSYEVLRDGGNTVAVRTTPAVPALFTGAVELPAAFAEQGQQILDLTLHVGEEGDAQ